MKNQFRGIQSGGIFMSIRFSNGAWPTMVTPYKENGSIDYEALARLIDWYIDNGADGLFATCQSSEIFHLSLDERIKLTKFVKLQTAGRVPVIASGHVSYDLEDQITELNAIAECGVDAVILISNRLAGENESDDVLLERLDQIVHALPEEIPLGFYECPYPYKRVLTPKVINYCTSSGRFYFLKDTCCDIGQIAAKLELLKGSNMHLYNANTSTLLDSLKLGATGYSGVMANFQMKLYAWLVKHWQEEPELAEEVQEILTVCSFIELKNYPANAKCFLNLSGVKMNESSRRGTQVLQSATEILELKQILSLTKRLEKKLGI
jgi:4-hydroxy-tetrahydrodipicolinate synthase